MDLDKGAGLKLDTRKVLQALHHLVPYVERWAFDSLEDQDAFVAEMLAQRPQEVQHFNSVVDAAAPIISRWGSTLTELDKPVSELTEADQAHPYWSFLNVLKLREITGYSENDPVVAAAKQRFAQELRIEQYREATAKAAESFRFEDYTTYVAMLRPFEDLLTPVQRKKLELAVRRMEG